ncbi:MAG: hypothetical protein WC755_03690 [Candidatus Woesearchaeota archaeon]|jgi:hypothetical protein
MENYKNKKSINEETIKINTPIYKKQKNYWVINPVINLIASVGLGYTLEKSQIPMFGLSGLDTKLGLGLNIAIGGIECITDEQSNKKIIASSGIGYGCFFAGNYAGRVLAKLY